MQALAGCLPELRSADVVVATTTGTAMALAAWSRAGRLRKPLVGIVAGLLNDPWRRTRRLTTLPLLHRIQSVLYGPGELDGLRGLGLAERRARRAVRSRREFLGPGNSEQTREVLAIGNDGHRDWETLIAAAPHISAPIRIFTSETPPSTLPANVTWERADWYSQVLTDEEVRDLYRRAAVVVVPTKDVPQPSGQSVTLQAMATGRPVVLSNTRGLWAPAELRDGENLVLVPPADPRELAHSVRLLLDDQPRANAIGLAARKSVLAGATSQRYAERLLEVCRLALAAG